MKLVFIAIPSKGTVVNGQLSEQFLRKLAELHEKYPDVTFVSPMVQDYQILKYMNQEPIWENWGQHCRTLIERCDEVWVLMYDGWKESVGVNAEIKHASLYLKPTYYFLV